MSTRADRVTLVWGALVALTCVSWAVGGTHHASDLGAAAVLVIAFGKVHWVGMDFMGLRRAPGVLRLIFGAWVVLTGALLVALTLFA